MGTARDALRFAILYRVRIAHSQEETVAFWRRKGGIPAESESCALDPLASSENARTFGVAFGVGQALGANPVLTGAAGLYAKAEAEERKRKAAPPAAGNSDSHLPRGAKRAGEG